MKKYLPIAIICILVLSGLGAVAITDDKSVGLISETKTFGKLTLAEDEKYTTISLEKATSTLMGEGVPSLPVVTEVYTFPFGTKINDVIVTFSEQHQQKITKEIKPALVPQYISNELVQKSSAPLTFYKNNIYPEERYSYKASAGLYNGEELTFLAVHYCPISYSPSDNTLYISDSAQIEISYDSPENPITFSDDYDLLILAPSEFADALQPLVDFKNDNGIPTMFTSLEDIPSVGIDVQEDIKYYIKDVKETYGITYVLLVGAGVLGEEIFPVRDAWIPSEPYEDSFPSDLYYADIYLDGGGFASWDADGDGRYCEIPDDLDAVGISPDVYIARLPCNNVGEVKDAVKKITKFAQNNRVTNKIVQMGGDTFPGDGEGIYEGEYANAQVMNVLPGYTTRQLWASTNKLNRFNILMAMYSGVDFMDWSGHGSPVSWATHPPNDDSIWIPEGFKYTGFLYVHLYFVFNFNKLPVVVLNACSTSKFSNTANCLSWEFVKKKIGGSIATYGASGIGFGSQGSSETERLFGWMELHLHQEFVNSGILGNAWGDCITNYANSFMMDDVDYKTVCEMSLFGDPSLNIGTGS